GEKFEYSNVGYTIAAAMAERATGVTWENLVKREVFDPLKLMEAGFGPPQSGEATLEAPRGHRKSIAGKFAVDDKADNTPLMGPSGSVHMSLTELCHYGMEHLRGELGSGKLLTAETYKKLHTPYINQNAYGWVKMPATSDIPHVLYWHNGSNTLWYAL